MCFHNFYLTNSFSLIRIDFIKYTYEGVKLEQFFWLEKKIKIDFHFYNEEFNKKQFYIITSIISVMIKSSQKLSNFQVLPQLFIPPKRFLQWDIDKMSTDKIIILHNRYNIQ